MMFGLVIHGIGGTFLFLLWIWAVLDVIATDSILIRNLPKVTWLLLVLFIPTIGAVAWLLLGRPEGAGMSLGGQRSALYVDPDDRWQPSSGSTGRYIGPDDDPSFGRSSASPSPSLPTSMREEEPLAIRERKLMEREAELARREAELAEKQGDDGDDHSDDRPDDGSNGEPDPPPDNT